jgi:orotidine-5'-phosphate decarboxylase
MNAKNRIALACDIPLEEALALYEKVQGAVGWVKVGLSLFVEHGPLAVQAFRDRGARVFLDLKLHDIPNTVELASARAAKLGVELLTVHASGGELMLKAAEHGAAGKLKVLAVTVLTSLDDAAVAKVGFSRDASAQAEHLAELAAQAGVGGLVCSAREVVAIRKTHPRMFLCTPGIRPVGAASGDQARTETPGSAIRSGSDLLVIGRPIYGVDDPVAAAQAIHDEVAAALKG